MHGRFETAVRSMEVLRRSVACVFFFQAEDGIRDYKVTGVQTCALPICQRRSEQLSLRRLTRAVGSLEGHEHEPPRYAARAREERQHAGRTVMVRGARQIGRASCRERV